MLASVHKYGPLVEGHIVGTNNNVMRMSNTELSLFIEFISNINHTFVDEDDLIHFFKFLKNNGTSLFKSGFE